MTRTFISLARADLAPKDVLQATTHNSKGHVFDSYTTWSWKTLCEAVASLNIQLRTSSPIMGQNEHLTEKSLLLTEPDGGDFGDTSEKQAISLVKMGGVDGTRSSLPRAQTTSIQALAAGEEDQISSQNADQSVAADHTVTLVTAKDIQLLAWAVHENLHRPSNSEQKRLIAELAKLMVILTRNIHSTS